MEDIKFTKEMLTLLYDRAKEHISVNHGIEVDYIKLNSDGTITGTYRDRLWRSDTYDYDVNVDDLNNSDYDQGIAERKENERNRIKQQKIEYERLLAEQKIKEEKEELALYQQLKTKYESK